MSEWTLIIGNRNYSSWSMRAWLAMDQTGTPFEERTIWFDEDPDRRQRLSRSPAGRVPILLHGDRTVWDSLAIAEYLAETFPEAGLWPTDAGARAHARAICAEMHAGFPEIRRLMPMNCRVRREPRDRGEAVTAEVRRVVEIWTGARRDFGGDGPFLFGGFSLADAFYAPVACRFRSYAISLSDSSTDYAENVLAHPPVKDWIERGEGEGHPDPPYDGML